MQHRLLNILLVFIISMLVFNYFFPNKTEKEVQKTWIFLKTLKNDYTVPNMPVLELDNNTNKEIKFNTCSNFQIFKDSKKIEQIPSSFCKDEVIKANTKYSFKLDSLSKLFFISWQYSFNLTLDKELYSTNYTQSEKWFFNNLFSNIFYAPVYNFFVFLISFLPSHNLWIAIIIVTLIIRIILLVPQHHILVNSKKMNEIQPKIKEIQKKYKNDQAKIWMELLELYKKEWVNPLGSCLPLLIQFPLLIVLYWVISGITDTSNYHYLYTPLKNFDISAINTHFLWLNLMITWWIVWWVLGLTIWVTQWIQTKLSLTVHTKKKDKWEIITKDKSVDDPVSEFMPDPDIMNKFMLWWMPIMIAFTAYFVPTWIWIYWLIGTIFTIFQQMIVNKLQKVKK